MIKDSKWLVEVSQRYTKYLCDGTVVKRGTLVATIKLEAKSVQEASDKVQKVIDSPESEGGLKDGYISNICRDGIVDYDLTL